MNRFSIAVLLMILCSAAVNAQPEQCAGRSSGKRTEWEGRLFRSDEKAPEAPARFLRIGPPHAGIRPNHVVITRTLNGEPAQRSAKRIVMLIQMMSIASRIEEMQRVCRLTPRQVRKLQVAAKGVAHRTESAENHSGQPAPRMVLLPLWTRTVDKVLSEEQKKRWSDHR